MHGRIPSLASNAGSGGTLVACGKPGLAAGPPSPLLGPASCASAPDPSSGDGGGFPLAGAAADERHNTAECRRLEAIRRNSLHCIAVAAIRPMSEADDWCTAAPRASSPCGLLNDVSNAPRSRAVSFICRHRATPSEGGEYNAEPRRAMWTSLPEKRTPR